MSTLKVNTLDTRSGTTITVTAGKTIAGTDIIDTAQIASGAVGTTELDSSLDLSGKTLTLPATLPATAGTNITALPGANITGTIPAAALGNVDTSSLEDDIAILGFKVAANGSLAKYNLDDQIVDAFEDASGIDASASTDEIRNIAGKYYSGVAGATGGTVTTFGAYEIREFTSTVVFVPGVAGTADILVVAGGGAGGSSDGAGGAGGAGGLVYKASQSVLVQNYPITVGAGGVGVTPYATGGTGQNSVAFGITANGGGGGSGGSGGGSQGGGAGGSGGGGGYSGQPGGSPTQSPSGGGTGFGYGGGAGAPQSGAHGTGGGGGAGGVGATGTTGTGGAGGVGKDYSATFGTGVGDSGWFASGGGGGAMSGGVGAASAGGGGNGAIGAPGGTGEANTGGGGGGGNGSPPTADGGTGVVIMRSAQNAFDAYNDMSLVSTATVAQSAPTKGDIVFTYTNGAGTAVVGTNITAQYSGDNGSTWTDFGIAAADTQGTTGGHTIVTKHDVALTSTSGTNMKWRIKTLVQGAVMSTRIHAVSLGWS